MLLHRNMVSALAGAIKNTPIYPTDVHLSYLPLAHIFERVVVVSGMSAGAALGFYQGVPSPPFIFY
jgi:long-chain acyl-CoA synthetase